MQRHEYEIMHYLNKLKEQSHCLDKQVACCITDFSNNIIASGVNQIIKCDKNCHDKENRTCEVIHAEIVACRHLSSLAHNQAKAAYLNLFPCVPCQQALANWVSEIVVFGPQHKDQWFKNIRLEPNLYAKMLEWNGEHKQLSIAQGELAELITAISDFFYRPDKGKITEDIVDEILDAEFMLDQIKLVTWKHDPEAYNYLRELRRIKYSKLLRMIHDNVI